MDYFSFKKADNTIIENDSKIPSRPTFIRYSTSYLSNKLSTSLPSPPITPQIQEENKQRKRRFSTPTCTFNLPRLHILVVDDNPINLQILARLLKLHLNHYIEHIELVKSGVKALDLLRHRPFDIVLMDIDMPILNGIETTKHIRSSLEYNILPKNRKIPIVAVTTNNSPSWHQKFIENGMDGYVSKPISAFELKLTLSKVLQLPILIFPSTPE